MDTGALILVIVHGLITVVSCRNEWTFTAVINAFATGMWFEILLNYES